jgi:excisionase family DNA binding protein
MTTRIDALREALERIRDRRAVKATMADTDDARFCHECQNYIRPNDAGHHEGAVCGIARAALLTDDQAARSVGRLAVTPTVATCPPWPGRLLGLGAAAAYLSLSRRSLYNLANRGELHLCKIGRRTLVDIADLDRLVLRHQGAAHDGETK